MSNLHSLYSEARSTLAASNTLYPLMINAVSLVRPRQRALMAKSTTEIVIDGFPRSANTYFVSLFEIAQRRPIEIAHHLHESYQIRFAEQRRLPCVLLIRRPADAIASAVLRHRRSDMGALIRNYVRFYRNALACHDRAVIAPFEIVTADANQIIAALNRSYGTGFLQLPPSELAQVRKAVEQKDKVAFGTETLDETRAAAPSERKRSLGRAIKDRLTSEHARPLQEANEVFEEVIGRADLAAFETQALRP